MTSPSDKYSIEVQQTPSDADLAFIGEGILAHNREQIGDTAYRQLCITIRDEDLGPIGGLFGCIRWGWLDLQALWVAPEHRHKGLGTRLVCAAEGQAQLEGCHSVWLATETFQAETFYLHQGYEPFARLEDYPPGHARIFMSKSVNAG